MEDRVQATQNEAQDCVCEPVQATYEEDEVERLVEVFKALAHPVRLRMVGLIHEHGGQICVCEFENHFDVKQPTISHHLRVLRDAGVIHSRHQRSWVHHYVRADTLEWLQTRIALLSENPAAVAIS